MKECVKNRGAINVECLNPLYKEVAEEIGVDNTLKLYNMYNGCQVMFPKRLYSTEYISCKIASEYNGKNTCELARKYDYSERSIRRILSKHEKNY